MKGKKRIVTGVIGYDIHYGGNVILQYALREAGFEVISLGTQVSQKDFINAAIEASADAILVSSLYGHAEMDCQGFGNSCKEAGLNIPLYIGGSLQVGAEQLGVLGVRSSAALHTRILDRRGSPCTVVGTRYLYNTLSDGWASGPSNLRKQVSISAEVDDDLHGTLDSSDRRQLHPH